MDSDVVDSFNSLTNRLVFALLLHLAQRHMGTFINPTRSVLWVLILGLIVFAELWLEKRIAQIKNPQLFLLQDFLATLLSIIGGFLVYLFITALDSVFLDGFTGHLTLGNVDQPIVLILFLSISMTMGKYYSGYFEKKTSLANATKDP